MLTATGLAYDESNATEVALWEATRAAHAQLHIALMDLVAQGMRANLADALTREGNAALAAVVAQATRLDGRYRIGAMWAALSLARTLTDADASISGLDGLPASHEIAGNLMTTCRWLVADQVEMVAPESRPAALTVYRLGAERLGWTEEQMVARIRALANWSIERD